MAEKLPLPTCSSVSMPFLLLQEYINEGFPENSRRGIEQKTSAYFPLKPEYFTGFLYHPDGNGPETSYFHPEDVPHWTPEAGAIGRIGVQFHYWDMIANAVKERQLLPSNSLKGCMLVLFPDGDGKIRVDTSTASIKTVAEKRGDDSPRFPQYIISTNYGGDADFYGADKDQIFPMRIKDDNKEVVVIRKDLGISDGQSKNTWVSWKNIWEALNLPYHGVTLKSLNRFIPLVSQVLREEAKNREIFTSLDDIARRLAMKIPELTDKDYWETLRIIDEEVNAFHYEDGGLDKALRQHANNLKDMYETAKSYRQDIYPY